jgi:hypothetical protein
MNYINDLYNQHVQSLFIMPFDEISKKYKNELFTWKNFEPIFLNIYKLLLKSENENDFIKYYYLLTFLYLNYTNYLKYSLNSDFNNVNIYTFISNIKFNKNIVEKIFKFSFDKKIKKIIKIYNPFINFKFNKLTQYDYLQKIVKLYIDDTKQMEKLCEMNNSNIKKIMNIIIFRYLISKNNNYNNYTDFIINNIIDTKNLINILDFNYFIKLIPNSKKILSLKTNNYNFDINININKVINFLLLKFSKINVEFNDEKSKIILSNKKYKGKIIIKFDKNISSIEFNNYQINYSLIHFNIDELKDFAFLKKTNSFIEIGLNSIIIKDLSSLLEIFHLLILSFKILESYPTDIYDSVNPVEYSNYYFLTFSTFIEFVKYNLNKDSAVNKFMIDLIKYLYIYSYYDYYYYYSNKLLDTIINNYEYKDNIFKEFSDNLKEILKLPNELYSYPPFFNINDDINSIIYYNFEIPSFFKLFDLINAICYVFDKKYYINNSKNFTITDIINKYFKVDINNDTININNNIEISLISDSLNKSDIESKLNNNIILNIPFKNKDLINNKNTYIELNLENSVNCILNTEII